MASKISCGALRHFSSDTAHGAKRKPFASATINTFFSISRSLTAFGSSHRDMAYIRQFPHVTMTQHMAFYTEEAVRSMVYGAVKNLRDLSKTGSSAFELF